MSMFLCSRFLLNNNNTSLVIYKDAISIIYVKLAIYIFYTYSKQLSTFRIKIMVISYEYLTQ